MSYSEDIPSCSSVPPRREVELMSLWQDPSFCRLGTDKNINICPQISSRKHLQVNSRTKALNIVHNQTVAVEVCLQRDVCELQRIYYARILRPLQDLRSSLLALVTEGNEKPTSSEIIQKIHNTTVFAPTSNTYKRLVKHVQRLLSAGPSLKEKGFTDTFWLDVMLSADSITQKVIRETEKEVLSYLVDVNCDTISCGASSPVEEEGYGFQVSFKFEANPFFHNRELVKRYMIDIYPREREDNRSSNHGDESLMESGNLISYSGPRLVEIIGTKIDWKIKDETDKEDLKVRKEGDACLSSMLEYFQFNWKETTGKHSGAAEYDFLIGTYFRDILVTNAYGMYHRKFRYSAAQSETCMTSAKSCSATELGNTFDQNRDFPATQNSRSLTSRSNLLNQPQPHLVAKSPLSVKNNSSIFSLLQRGHATKLNMFTKNHTSEERINQLIATPRRNSVNERLSRKRAFSERDFPGERELRFPYKIMLLSPTMTKRDKSKTKESSIISGTTYDPISSCHLAQTVIKTQNNQAHLFSSTPKLGLMARAAIGVDSVRQDLPQSSTGGSRQRLSDSDNAFNKLLRQLDQLKGENPAQFNLLDFTIPARSKIPSPSCGVWNNSDEDEEKDWEDVSEDLTSPAVESKHVLDVSGEARYSYQHQAEATAPKRKLVKLSLKAARKIAAANKKAPLVPPTKKTTRCQKAGIAKAFEKRSSKKMVNGNKRFLKQKKHPKSKHSHLIQPNSDQPSCSKAGFVSPKKMSKKTTTARRPTASCVKRLGSWSTMSSGSDYTPITTKKATKTNSTGLQQSAGACKMKSAVRKLSKTREATAPKTNSLLTITPAMWKVIVAQHQTRTSSDLPADNERKEAAQTTTTTTTNSAELVAQIEKKKAPIESKESEPATAICTCNEPHRSDSKTSSSSSEVILYYSNLPGQEVIRNTVVVEDDCAEQYVEKTNGKDTPCLLELPVWFMQAPAHQKSSKSSISSMNRHGANANGSAEPMAKKALLSRTVTTTSSRSLKRKSFSLDDGNVSSTKIPRLNIGMALVQKSPAPQQHGFVSLLNDVASTLARPFRACKRLFTGEIKHSS